ncbi:HD domain-containing protein [Arcanobacterium phocae]|uniref:Predicted metal-dependent phosphohydrolase, HD superfamily n=1 Tax=Arcanobacterium phocae TaxID=131112 RepID=A0A1H2LD29_9ACTO|nr:hypothetical protein [Arcanobacterium phocae]SDU78903.1 Predicted metal-dependent phosphohydrolase, HD superfamily [Arcanobacterium phocae]
MVKMDVPAWVVQAFVRSARDAGATAERDHIERVAYELLDIWSSPDRFFHNTRHVIDMLTRVDTLASETQNPCLVRLATWGHGLVFNVSDDAVYSRNGGEDERASADVADKFFAEIGIPADNRHRIAELIFHLHKRHDLPGSAKRADETARFDSIDVDRLALYDAHFGTLANPPQRYKTYVSQVREEYPRVSEYSWLMARRQIVEHLLARKRIFLTPLANEWEQVARQNLGAELERITLACYKLGDNASDQEFSPVATPNQTTTATDPTDLLFQTAQEEQSTVSDEDTLDVTSSDPAIINDDVTELFQPHVPVVKRSSLEELDEAFAPGAPPRILDHSQAEAARREQIAQETLETIERKQNEAREERGGRQRNVTRGDEATKTTSRKPEELLH